MRTKTTWTLPLRIEQVEGAGVGLWKDGGRQDVFAKKGQPKPESWFCSFADWAFASFLNQISGVIVPTSQGWKED